ncbi:Ankyrin repeat domain containing protein 11 [Fasciola hepatica]|uniref:Ankyrin repeat domain containing protein 11 n=1 Tax=Fasciola hepatica TaxID=6192 RepID=A0A4E0R4Z0_FASHE|nr:Ankyrin repeat domain containing protein 11 [Fasciola hepatica]
MMMRYGFRQDYDDATPIKKRKLRSRTDGHSDPCTARLDTGVWTSATETVYNTGGTNTRSQGVDDLAPNDVAELGQTTSGQDSLNAVVKEELAASSESRPMKSDTQKDGGEEERDLETHITTAVSPDSEHKMSAVKVESEQENRMDTSESPNISVSKFSGSTTSIATSSTVTSSTNFAVKSESSDDAGEGVSFLRCPAGPDDSKQHPELLMFENPFEKIASVQRKLRELINNLVEVHPKAPCGYPDYLLVTRNYLLASQTPTLTKRTPPPNLKPTFVELFNEQEEERYAQALKHQSEREHLRLCAEQAVLRAHTRAALAVANLSKPLSFCSVLAYKNLTYVPPAGKTDQRDEENVRDRFTSRTFFGWLGDIKDTFQQEKKKLLCRQLHEAESLMMVQRLDWESKIKESQLHDYGTDALKETPHHHVPLIHVPNDFPLFVHDPVHRTGPV